jgi:hypothetical protein
MPVEFRSSMNSLWSSMICWVVCGQIHTTQMSIKKIIKMNRTPYVMLFTKIYRSFKII